jgi:hypothetical protein
MVRVVGLLLLLLLLLLLVVLMVRKFVIGFEC